MSFETIRPYFKARLKTVDENLKEWTDGFNEDNIPGNVIHKSYVISFGPHFQIKQNQDCIDFNGVVSLHVYFKAFRDPKTGIDNAYSLGERILKECLKASNRATQDYIKNVLGTSIAVEPFDESNDNLLRIVIDFNLNLILDIE